MKKISFFPAFLCLVVSACSYADKTNSASPDAEGKVIEKAENTGMPDSSTLCFKSVSGNSLVDMQINNSQDSVIGSLSYALEAKDKNEGTIVGKWRGDTLLANYKFISEGIESVREVVFLKTADGLYEGYGPVKDENGKMVFEDRSKIDFSKSTPLSKVECNKGNL